MADRKDQVSNDAEKEKPTPRLPATGPLPDAGALDEDDIQSIDLKPRSNGETDWQDDIPAGRPDEPARKRR